MKNFNVSRLAYLSFAFLALSACTTDNGNEEQVKESTVTVPQNDTETPKNWRLVWQDEFDMEQIDSNKWSYEVNCAGGGNEEQQCYTKSNKNAYVDNGVLHIEAIKGDVTGPKLHDDEPGYDPRITKSQPYSSARLRTKNLGDWKYGRFEIRAQLPAGQGIWPAIWMLPTDWVYGGWPASGEIDIMEAVNLKTLSDDPDAVEGTLEARVHGTLHYGPKWPDNIYTGKSYTLENQLNPADDFHEYAIEWEEGEIRWYVDGIHYSTQTSETWYSQTKNENGKLISNGEFAPFDQRFHLILNLAVGGNWPSKVNEKGIDASINSRVMKIDYVRVYQ